MQGEFQHNEYKKMFIGIEIFPGIQIQLLINPIDRLSFACRNSVIYCMADAIECEMLNGISFTNHTLTKSFR